MLPFPIKMRVPAGPPRNLRWTVDQFHYLGDLGVFEGARPMLIDGVIVEQGPMNPPHRIALENTVTAIREAFGKGWRFCAQLPLVLSQTTDPEPDLAVVRGEARGTTAHPTTADLVIEVADTSLRYDTTEKASLYAAGGIADYWVVDVNAGQLLVFRDPVADASQPHAFGYATQTTHATGDVVAPLAVPSAGVKVADLMP